MSKEDIDMRYGYNYTTTLLGIDALVKSVEEIDLRVIEEWEDSENEWGYEITSQRSTYSDVEFNEVMDEIGSQLASLEAAREIALEFASYLVREEEGIARAEEAAYKDEGPF